MSDSGFVAQYCTLVSKKEVALQFARLRNALAARDASLTLISREGVSNPQLSLLGEIEGAVRARQTSGSSRIPTKSW